MTAVVDFAHYLREARREAGLNQLELADAVGLTGSYISILESKKKPPPSDRVVRELARALGRQEREMLEVAHLDRSPDDIRKKIRALDRRLAMERRLTKRLLSDYLPSSLWHFWKVRGYSEYGIEKVRIDGRRKNILRKVLRRIGHLTSRDDFEEESRLVIESLPVEERSVLAEVLPELVGADLEPTPGDAEDPADRTVPVVSSPPGRGRKPTEVLGAQPVSRESPGRYFLVAPGTDMAPRIEEGDLLLVTPRQKPKSGDVVVVVHRKRVAVRQVAAAGNPLLLVAANPKIVPETARPRDIEGVVIEIRRPLS